MPGEEAAMDCCETARLMIQRAGYGVKRVYRLIGAEDSGEGVEIALYMNHEDEPYEARLGPGGTVTLVTPGW